MLMRSGANMSGKIVRMFIFISVYKPRYEFHFDDAGLFIDTSEESVYRRDENAPALGSNYFEYALRSILYHVSEDADFTAVRNVYYPAADEIAHIVLAFRQFLQVGNIDADLHAPDFFGGIAVIDAFKLNYRPFLLIS